MKISLNWVKEFTDITVSNDELIRRIGAQLGAIEEIEDWGAYYDPEIIIAEVIEATEHPDADKLGVYVLKINENGETRNLVAGDKTLEPGNKVAYIPPGARVPLSIRQGEPFEIGERELRGKVSQGMMGSAKEILFGEDHERVMKLATDAQPGESLKNVFKLDDVIIDVENKMFTHRPDLFGILGLARELAGIQGNTFVSPDWYSQTAADILDSNKTGDLQISVTVQEPELCNRFTAIALDNVKIAPSPAHIQTMLMRVGIRPINNVVDATNYIMYLTAQPLHAFDYDKVVDNDSADIVVRKPHSGETLEILDGRTLTLEPDTLLVATKHKPLSVAGSMGGANSEVDDTTTRVIIEVAHWDLYSIRRTSFAHGIFTDAVTRFNKGQSPYQTRIVTAQAVDLLQKIAGAQIASGLIDEKNTLPELPKITVSSEFVNVRLGSQFSATEIQAILQRTELSSDVEGDTLTVHVPFWRMDLSAPEDIVEEVYRLVGFDSLPIELPLRQSKPNLRSVQLAKKQKVAAAMVHNGNQEVLTYNFVSSGLLKRAGFDDQLIEKAYKIRNSLSPELEYMRMNLLPSLLDKVNSNLRQGYESVRLFEINKSHNRDEMEDALPRERMSLASVIADESIKGAPYFTAKHLLNAVCNELGVAATFQPIAKPVNPWQEATTVLLHGERSAQVLVDGVIVGYVGELNDEVLDSFKLPTQTAVFEIDIARLNLKQHEYTALSRFPTSYQDITLEVPDTLSFEDVNAALLSALEIDADVSVECTAIYRAEKGSQRRITFSLAFASSKRTLKTKEINTVLDRAAKSLKDRQIMRI